MKISYERKDSVELYDSDIERMAVEIKRGSSFEDAFYGILSGYDDDIFYRRDLFKDEVEKIVQNIVPKDNQRVTIIIDNLTLAEAYRIANNNTLNFHLKIPENIPVKIDVSTIKEENNEI